MAVDWTLHRFAGGVLALDTTNTVVHRGKPEKSFDRFDDPVEIARFAEAASGYRADELGGRRLQAGDSGRRAARVMAIRETTDALFRDAVKRGGIDQRLMPNFLRACADGLDAGGAGQGDGLAFEAALATSALSLLPAETVRRLRICPNCSWLFLDRSRNSSRMWCDMTVCGNRSKAKAHYSRRRAATEEQSDA